MTSPERNPAPIDWEFQPRSYRDATDPIAAILMNVKGQFRRQSIRSAMLAGGPEAEKRAEMLLAATIPEMTTVTGDYYRLGGEHLPEYLPKEVEIARIVTGTDIVDVVSIRARSIRAGGLLYYRIVSECDDSVWSGTPKSSSRPLSLRELVCLIESARDAIADGDYGIAELYRNYVLEAGGDLPQAVNAYSDIYHDLERYYQAQAQEWLDAHVEESGEDDQDGYGISGVDQDEREDTD